MRTAESSIEDARAANHAVSLCYALAFGGMPDRAVGRRSGRGRTLHRHAARPFEKACAGASGALMAAAIRESSSIERGDLDSGLRLLRAGLDEFDETTLQPRYVPRRSCSWQKPWAVPGRIADGLAAIDEAIAHSSGTEEHWFIAELLRVKGELLLLQGAPGAAATAEDHFRQALDWARRQGALSWELRAADEPRPSAARSRPPRRRHRLPPADLRPLHRGFRYRRSCRGETATG